MNFNIRNTYDELDENEFKHKLAEYFGKSDLTDLSLESEIRAHLVTVENIERLAGYCGMTIRNMMVKLQDTWPDIFTIEYLKNLRKIKALLQHEKFQ